METDYIYPKQVNDFSRGTVYQVLEPISGVWSEELTISKMCNSTKEFLELLIQRKRIRIKIK
jgi:hypothetical protein